jgi:Ca2+-binding EF-hand superfamily protein
MRRLPVVTCILGLAAAHFLFAAGPPAKKPEMPDYTDVVYLASDKPVLIRLHLRLGEKPYFLGWDEYMKKLFAQFDANNDGFLTKNEVEGRVPNVNFLRFHLQGSIGLRIQGQTVPMAALDTNKDGKVSLAEFRDYYTKNAFGALRFNTFSNDAATTAVTNTLFKYLDTNKDGKLTAEELAAAPERLRKLDEDEDELFTAEELNPAGNSGGTLAPPTPAYGQPAMVAATGPNLLQIQTGQPLAPLVRQLISRYDRDKDGKLSLAELKVGKDLFDRLDVDKNGKLDAKELEKFFTRDADLTFRSRLGAFKGVGGVLGRIGIGGVTPRRLELFNPSKRVMPMAKGVKRLDADTVAFSFGDTNLELQAGDNQLQSFSNIRNFYMGQFRELDQKNRGYVEKSQEADNMGNPFLFYIFPLADRNNDGKLTKKELEDYLTLQTEGSGCHVTIQVNDLGRSLFSLIDADADGRLSTREFRTAWARLKPFAGDKPGLAKADIPRRLQISLSQGSGQFRAVAIRGVGAKSIGAVPGWFRKMDRNGDGDISPKEFLGTAEEFRALDLDGDGLISAEEARKFEASRGKKK